MPAKKKSKKKSKDDSKAVEKLLERARRAQGGLADLARRAGASADAVAGAVHDLERLLSQRHEEEEQTSKPAEKRTAKRVSRRQPVTPTPENES